MVTLGTPRAVSKSGSLFIAADETASVGTFYADPFGNGPWATGTQGGTNTSGNSHFDATQLGVTDDVRIISVWCMINGAGAPSVNPVFRIDDDVGTNLQLVRLKMYPDTNRQVLQRDLNIFIPGGFRIVTTGDKFLWHVTYEIITP